MLAAKSTFAALVLGILLLTAALFWTTKKRDGPEKLPSNAAKVVGVSTTEGLNKDSDSSGNATLLAKDIQ